MHQNQVSVLSVKMVAAPLSRGCVKSLRIEKDMSRVF